MEAIGGCNLRASAQQEQKVSDSVFRELIAFILQLRCSSYNNVFKPTMSIQEVRMRDDANLWCSTVYGADS
jgi:hypothetical protein